MSSVSGSYFSHQECVERRDEILGDFDVAFSIFGFVLFSDWRGGLREQARVLIWRKGMHCELAEASGGGTFHIMDSALRLVFSGRVLFLPCRLMRHLRLKSHKTSFSLRHMRGPRGHRARLAKASAPS